jgi:hypothetical protein
VAVGVVDVTVVENGMGSGALRWVCGESLNEAPGECLRQAVTFSRVDALEQRCRTATSQLLLVIAPFDLDFSAVTMLRPWRWPIKAWSSPADLVTWGVPSPRPSGRTCQR